MDSAAGPLLFSPTVLTGAILSALVVIYVYLKNVYSFWEKRGVKGPNPWPLVGNLVEILLGNRIVKDLEWVRAYGKIYGTYLGLKPCLVIADPDVLKEVGVKNFGAFTNHGQFNFLDDFKLNFIFFLRDQKWKRVRATLTPTFTSMKIKRMYKLLDVCADDLVDCFDEQLATTGEVVNVKNTFSMYSMDAISSCCYGIKLERLGAADLDGAASRNKLAAVVIKLLKIDWPRTLVGMALPGRFLRMFGFELVPEDCCRPLVEHVTKVIEYRRESGRKSDDYLQLLLDAKFDDQLVLNELDEHENHHAGLTSKSLVENQEQLISEVRSEAVPNGNSSFSSSPRRLTLSDKELLSNAAFMLIVGLETAETLLTHCASALAFHPDCQERLHAELGKIVEYSADDVCRKKPRFDYDKLTACKYLDAVISETLRRLPSVLQMDREANCDYQIEKYNIHIPKGTLLNLAYYSIMNDPDYWPEPAKFDPERFMPGNKENIYPGSYCPFGIGPRHCLGMRFGLTESKLALAKIVMQFRFEPAPNTTFPPEAQVVLALLNATKYPFVRVKRRRS